VTGHGLLSTSFPILFNMESSTQEKHETLKVDESSLPPPLSEEESYVKIGDRAIALPNDNKE